MNDRSLTQRTTQNPVRPLNRQAASTLVKSNPQQNGESHQPFVEDFNMEHCCSAVSVALLAISADSNAMDPRIPRNPHAHPFNAPSCVYLG
jgi:hypothetical protein